MAAAAGSIPLLCNICPKKPTFSDVSHLLTHIASKGHLSHYYKVKVRSGTEEASRRMIEAYDRWYADWCVEELMSERMSLKEKKRTRTKASGEHQLADTDAIESRDPANGLSFSAPTTSDQTRGESMPPREEKQHRLRHSQPT